MLRTRPGAPPGSADRIAGRRGAPSRPSHRPPRARWLEMRGRLPAPRPSTPSCAPSSYALQASSRPDPLDHRRLNGPFVPTTIRGERQALCMLADRPTAVALRPAHLCLNVRHQPRPQTDAALAIERHASFAPTARHAAWRTRTCEAAQPVTAQPRDRRRPATARTRTRPHPPSRPDPRCRHRCTPAEHQRPRSPGIARGPRSPRANTAHHHGPRLRARSVAALNAPIAGPPHTRPATRPGVALCAPTPRRQPGAPRCEHDRLPRPPSARHSHHR